VTNRRSFFKMIGVGAPACAVAGVALAATGPTTPISQEPRKFQLHEISDDKMMEIIHDSVVWIGVLHPGRLLPPTELDYCQRALRNQLARFGWEGQYATTLRLSNFISVSYGVDQKTFNEWTSRII
jgi:hypothetical protein